MKVAIRYYSRTGNTRKLALAISETVHVEAKEVSVPLEDDVDILFLGSSVYAAGVDESVKRFLEENKAKIGIIVNFSTAALLSSTYRQIQKLAAEKGIMLAAEEFHCRGSFQFIHRGKPDEEDLKRVKAFAAKIVK